MIQSVKMYTMIVLIIKILSSKKLIHFYFVFYLLVLDAVGGLKHVFFKIVFFSALVASSRIYIYP